MQVQVAAAATALSTLAVAVAPAAQAAQEAFQLADVSVLSFLKLEWGVCAPCDCVPWL